MEVFLITIFALIAIAAIACACAFHGELKGMRHISVLFETDHAEGRQRERELKDSLELWQSKAIERAGLGPLHRKDTPTPDYKPTRFESPSQAITTAQRANKVPKAPVPAAIEQDFLADIGGQNAKKEN